MAMRDMASWNGSYLMIPFPFARLLAIRRFGMGIEMVQKMHFGGVLYAYRKSDIDVAQEAHEITIIAYSASW